MFLIRVSKSSFTLVKQTPFYKVSYEKLFQFRFYSHFVLLTIITSMHNERVNSSLGRKKSGSGKGKK